MVLQKRLGYGFNGYQVPTIPRGSRSARGKRPVSEKVENNKTCAFDILATIANTLLQDRETSPSTSDVTAKRAQFLDITKNTIKEEYHDGAKLYKAEACDQGSNDETVIAKDTIKSAFRPASIITKSDRSDKVACPEESTAGKSVDTLGNFSCSNVNFWDTCSSKDPIKLHIKPPVLINSDTTVNVPFGGAHSHSSSFRECRDDVQVVSRDNDENSSGCGQPRTIMLKAYRPQGVGNRKIRKLLASRNWEVAPRLLKDGEISNTDVQMKAGILSRKTCFTRRRTQRCSPFKRRKLFERSSMWTSDRGICNQVSGVSSPAIGKRSSFKAGDSHVKLSIKSFRVPELFIEIPETATVGSLKRAVMDAITAIIGDGLRVGVLLQGRKVRDDNKTLHQTGISHDDKLDSLGFTLEPSPSDAPPPLCSKDPHYLLSCDATQPQTRYPASPAIDIGASTSSLDHPSLTNSGDCLESDHDLVPSLTDTSLAKTTPNSRALISMQTMSVETLEVVPFHQKSRRSDEIVQRRIRRPFSVSEVEALVHAVEELGTGRWRDVKIRAFDNAKHRTYVDLKDKWKTLVHTARIAPQQRRGQPVPQELLDRVLSAHAYWSEQQTKHISEGCFISN